MIYAMSSIMQVSVGEGHGGCGQVHKRPEAADGNAVHPWGLTCASCQGFLAADPLWSRTIEEIPLTFDEQRQRDQLAVRGSADRDQLMLAALAKIAGIDVPASLARPLPAAAPVAAMLACPQGHAQPAGQNFCGQCGAPMRQAVPAAGLAAKVA